MSKAGTETVSVVMTDLVGSTAIATRLGPERAEELRGQHFALLRDALERSGGREVKNLGDGLMVVFDSAAQSLAGAIEMQQAIEVRNRRADEQLGVRIGISVGDAIVEEGDYFGEVVAEASRLCAHAEAGQIVLNALVRQLAGRREGHEFGELGSIELKGFADPVVAYELRWAPRATIGVPLPERLRELPATGYVGREAERSRLAELWGESCKGSLRLAIVSGEAGVGKTRLAMQLAMHAHGEGATVLYGRCDEDIGVPYQPWAQALDYLVREAPRAIIDAHVERYGADLARLTPSLGGRVTALPAPRQSDLETERYLLYAAAAGLLGGAAEQEPVVLILDDLHWADPPTLSLLRHVVGAGGHTRMIVLGTYRDSDLSGDHPLTALLADLHREQGVERIKLTGLRSQDVQALIEAVSGYELDAVGEALAREITRETAGNPFFAGELVRHLTESGALVREPGGQWRVVGEVTELGLPQSVREVVGRRVQRLGSEARAALSAAAVIGRDFDLDLLGAVVELPEGQLLDLLDAAIAAELLQEASERAGQFTFIHALVEHTLYEDLGAARRAWLHRLVAEALEQQCGDEPGERLGELAGHWAAAIGGTEMEKAIHYAQRAAERALAQLAPGEAARWFQQALEQHDQTSGRDQRQRCELLIGLGESQRQIGNPAYRETLLEAAALARGLGEADLLGEAVLANSRGHFSQTLEVDGERVAELEAAAAALPEQDARRAKVLALLAAELHHAGEPARCRELARQAIEIAERAGDEKALGYTIVFALQATLAPDTLHERRRLAGELVELARVLDDPRLSFWAAAARGITGAEAGDRPAVDSGLATVRTVAAQVPDASMEWAPLMFESHWRIVQGELGEAEKWAMKTFEAGRSSGQPDAMVFFGVTMFQIRYFQGRTGELVEQSARLARKAGVDSVYRAAGACSLVESGREGEARELLAREDLAGIPWDWNWAWTTFLWADICWRLGLVERAQELYELLKPFSGLIVSSGGLVSGSFDSALGALAVMLGRDRQARDHFAAGAALEEGLGAPLLLARTETRWARALIDGAHAGELEGAQAMLDRAGETAERLGGEGIGREVAASRDALAAIGG